MANKKKDISGSNGPNSWLKAGKFSLAQASVNRKFVTVAPDILGLFVIVFLFTHDLCR